MVALAIVIRARIDDDGDEGGDGPGSGDRLRVACASELSGPCRSLAAHADVQVIVEPAGDTARSLASGEPAIDAWLVPQPWPEMTDIGRGQANLAPLFEDTGEVLVRSPLLVVAVKGRDAVEPCAASRPSWRCVGDSAERGGRIGWVDPAESALGALNLGAATVGYLGSSDISTNDFTDEYRLWRNQLLDAGQSVSAPVGNLLLSPAFSDLAVATEAETRTATASATPDRLAPLQFLYPEPVVTADVVLAPVEGRALPQDVVRAATRALHDAGWRLSGDAPGDGEPALPSSSNLPSAGVLVALRQEAR